MRYELNKLPPQVNQSGWLGCPGATEEQLTRTEDRLGITLPHSYREFLKVTNGWYLTTPFVYKLWSTDEIEWFSVRHQDWINDFTDRYQRLHRPSPMNTSLNGAKPSLKIPPIPEADYRNYGVEQDSTKMRVEYLQKALEISDRANSTIYLLNPEIKTPNTPDGEWEAWFLEDEADPFDGDWRPGADRYPSFREMMEAEYRSFAEMQET